MPSLSNYIGSITRNSIGGSISDPTYGTISGQFDPRELFVNGALGLYYNIQDLSSLFQLSDGTTPVTTVGDPVGYVTDMSGNGNHATQATAGSRPVLGVRPYVGKRNILTYSQEFDNAAWGKSGVAVTANTTTAPDGTLTADTLTYDGTNNGLSQAASITGFTHSIYLKQGTARYAQLFGLGDTASAVNFDLQDGVVSGVSSGIGTIEAAAEGFWRCTWTASGTPGTVYINSASSLAQARADAGPAGTIIAWGSQVEDGEDATTYQKVVEWYNTTQADSPNVYFLAADGSNDFLTIPGSDASLKFLHDGTGAYVSGVWQAGIVPTPGTDYALMSTSNGAGVGMILNWNAGTAKYFALQPATVVDPAGSLAAMTPALIAASYKAGDSPPSMISINGTVTTDTQSNTPSSANAQTDLNLFRYELSGSYLLGSLDSLVILNYVPTASVQAQLTQFQEQQSGI